MTPNDRIIFGTGSVFLFRNQDCADKAKIQDTAESPIEFAFAMKEKEDAEDKANAAAKEEEKKRQEEETAAKMAELEAKMRAEAEEADKARKAMEEEY